MSEQELRSLIEKDFVRLTPSQIQFAQVSTTVNNKKKRRGNYRFTLVLKEVITEEEYAIVERPVQVDMLAQQPAYFFDQLFTNDDEELLRTGKPILTYLQSCEKKKGQSNTAVVKDISVLNQGRLLLLKRKICDIFLHMDTIQRKTNGQLYYADSHSGKYDITIYDPVKT